MKYDSNKKSIMDQRKRKKLASNQSSLFRKTYTQELQLLCWIRID